jgi:hypothetical protein
VVSYVHSAERQEALHGRLLGFDAWTRLPLADGTDAEVGDVFTDEAQKYPGKSSLSYYLNNVYETS